MRAARATDLARATPRPTGGDGDGPLADGRTPVECRTHCASSTGRQRCLARVEPVGRGGANGGGWPMHAAIGRFSSIDLVLDCMGSIFPIPPHI